VNGTGELEDFDLCRYLMVNPANRYFLQHSIYCKILIRKELLNPEFFLLKKKKKKEKRKKKKREREEEEEEKKKKERGERVTKKLSTFKDTTIIPTIRQTIFQTLR
jgi:hypothetical protein